VKIGDEIRSVLRFVARQEILFGVHVHVGLDDAEKAIHVANGMRVHVPVLLGLSANSPFWRADQTGLASVRTPIFRAFPRTGIPPTYKDWADYERRIQFMIEARVIADYTYLWHDVRPHPNFGTVEVRVMDSQTHVEHTLGLAALVQGLVKELSEHFDAGGKLARYPYEMLDENKWLAARHGLDGELVDLPSSERVPTRELARRLIDRIRDHARDLGSLEDLEAVDDLLERGNGSARQVVVYEANHDLREVMAEIVAATGFDADVADQAKDAILRLWDVFVSEDATLVEVNPLVKLGDGRMEALDGKVSLDDNAGFRHGQSRRRAPARAAADHHAGHLQAADACRGCGPGDVRWRATPAPVGQPRFGLLSG